MVENQCSFGIIKNAFSQWMGADEAVVNAYLFCEVIGNIGEIRIPVKAHKRELAIYMLGKDYSDNDILVATRITPRVLKIYKVRYLKSS